MIRFQNINNLDEYLKKTDAENIYMKKINSLQVSFTSLLTSITNQFHYFNSEINELNGDVASLKSDTDLLSNSINSLSTNLQHEIDIITYNTYKNSTSLNVLGASFSTLNNAYSTYTVANDNLLGMLSSSVTSNANNIAILSSSMTSVNQEISNLWNAIGANAGGYNYWKEFNKASAETYLNYGNGLGGVVTQLDNEDIIYSDYLSNSTMLNPSKLSYVFNSNILQTDANHAFNFGGEYDRIGLILPPAQEGATTYNQSVPMNLITATVKTLDVMMKYGYSDFNTNFYIKCLDANLINTGVNGDFNILSTNLNATAIHFANYYKNHGANFYSTFKLNDRVQVLGPWLNDGYSPQIDLRRHTLPYTNAGYSNLQRLVFSGLSNRLYLHNHSDAGGENGFGIGKLLSPTRVAITNGTNFVLDVQVDASSNNIIELLNSTTNANQAYNVTISPDFKASSVYMTVPNHVKLEIPDAVNSYAGGNKNVRFAVVNANTTQSLEFYHWNALSVQLTGVPYVTASWNTLKDFTVWGNTVYSNQTGLLKSITFDNNYISWCKYENSCSSVLNLNNNTFEHFYVTDIGKGFSFGPNFKNTELQIYAPSSGTYYSYNNPNAVGQFPQGLFKLLDFTGGTFTFAAGGSMENCVFNSIVVNAMNGTPPYGPWKYVWANSFELNNASIFYENKLEFDYAFYHCPFIQLGHTGLNAGMNAAGYNCSGELMFVDNAPTTSVNFRLTGNNTSKSIHAKIIEDQPYLISVDIRGWHPTRIIGFDQHYLFKNVASGYAALPDYKFTAHVDNVNDWNPYKQFFDPFNDGQGANRVVFVQN